MAGSECAGDRQELEEGHRVTSTSPRWIACGVEFDGVVQCRVATTGRGLFFFMVVSVQTLDRRSETKGGGFRDNVLYFCSKKASVNYLVEVR